MISERAVRGYPGAETAASFSFRRSWKNVLRINPEVPVRARRRQRWSGQNRNRCPGGGWNASSVKMLPGNGGSGAEREEYGQVSRRGGMLRDGIAAGRGERRLMQDENKYIRMNIN